MGRFNGQPVEEPPAVAKGPRFGPRFGGQPIEEPAAPAAPVGPHRPMQGPPEVFGPVTGETGLLSDPRLDQQAWIKAKAQDALARELSLTGGFGEGLDKMAEGIIMNADRPLSGVISAIKGDGYDFGKAVNAYGDQMRDERLGGVGTALGLAGSVLTPSPAGKQKLLIEALQGGVQSGIEGENLSTEGQNRTMGDRLTDVAVGAGVTGALGGLGRAIRPAELIDTPKAQQTLNKAIQETLAGQGVTRVEDSGTALRDALLREQGALKKEGKDAMRRGVAGDFAVTDNPGSSFMKEVDQAYSTIGDAPIPITPQGTPAASAFRDQIALEAGKGDSMTMAQLDALRVKARGLKSTVANKTDETALNNLEKSIDKMVDAKVASGEYVGSEDYRKAYQEGRSKYEKAMKISDLPKVRQILKDETIPGAAIADSLLSINTSSKSKAPAKLAAVITETLGEGSESLDAVRKGVLSTMFEGADVSPEAQARVLKTLERNENLIGELFTPDQVSELASIRADLTNAASAKDSASARAAAEKRIGRFLTTIVEEGGKLTASPGKAGAVAAVASGSGATGLGVAGILGAMKIAASRPVRSGLSTVAEAGAKTAGRQASQNESIDAAIPRDALINALGAQ